MPNTQVYGAEARQLMLKGIEKLNRAVSVTLGPAGRTVLFRHMGALISTKDGVTVAHEVSLADPIESIGADLVKGAARQTVDEAGDGTTTATLLSYAIYKKGVETLQSGHAEPVKLVRGIEKAVKLIVGDYDAKAKKFSGGILEQFAVPCSEELAFNAAKISANGDEAVARVVSQAVLKVGVDGALTIGNSNSQEHILETVDGIQIDSGFTHPYFITDPQRNRVAYDNVTVVLINRRISTAKEAESILEHAIKASQARGRAVSILILCDDIDNEALALIVKNRVKTDSPQIPVVVVRTPLWGDARRDLLEDIAVLTEAKRIESPKGKHYEGLSASDFGVAARVVVTGSKTIITAQPMTDDYKAKKFDPHVAQLKATIADESMRPDQIDAAKKRYANVTGGVAVIKVGGTSANSVEETKFRVEDAIHATRAAVSDGVVPGGGSALLFAGKKAFSSPHDPTESKDELLGFNILLDVLEEPMKQIAKNAGFDGKEIVDQVLEHLEELGANRNGFNAADGEYLDDMIAEGIVDPLRVVRAALNAAGSVAATTLLKTECVLGHDPEANVGKASLPPGQGAR